jgi:glycerol kinase
MEAIAFQIDDVVAAFETVTGPLAQLRCDGGMTKSRALMQLQSDVSALPVAISSTANLSAMGAAHLAGVQLGWWTTTQLETGLPGSGDSAVELAPAITDEDRQARRRAWARAVARTRARVDPTIEVNV